MDGLCVSWHGRARLLLEHVSMRCMKREVKDENKDTDVLSTQHFSSFDASSSPTLLILSSHPWTSLFGEICKHMFYNYHPLPIKHVKFEMVFQDYSSHVSISFLTWSFKTTLQTCGYVRNEKENERKWQVIPTSDTTLSPSSSSSSSS